jgi:hypothetical protein
MRKTVGEGDGFGSGLDQEGEGGVDLVSARKSTMDRESRKRHMEKR